jgi:hypothetical protein
MILYGLCQKLSCICTLRVSCPGIAARCRNYAECPYNLGCAAGALEVKDVFRIAERNERRHTITHATVSH